MNIQERIQNFKEGFKKFKESYSLTNKDPYLLDHRTLETSIKHENISLILDILSISVFSIIFYFIVRYQLVLIPFSNTYTFFTIQRDFAILIGYVFSWINIILMVVGIFRETLFILKIVERHHPSKRITLTIEDNIKKEKKDNENNPNLNKEKNVKKLGEIETDKPIIKILIFIFIIIITIFEMAYYLPFKTRFPHYNEPFVGVGQIYTSEYLIFLIIMLVFTIGKLFLIIMNIMGTIHRKSIFNEVLYIKVQNEYFNNLDLKAQPESNLRNEKMPDQQKVTNDKEKDNKNKPVIGVSSERISILNTSIEKVKIYNLKKLEIKKQMAYLKEREALLNLMNEEKLKNLYGKKGYKKYKKELKKSNKSKRLIQFEGFDTSQSNLYGYKMVESSSINAKYEDQTKNKELSESPQKKGKNIKEKPKKQKYDFR